MWLMRYLIVPAALFLLLPLAAANGSHTPLDASPGAVTPNSAFYGLETAWDNAAVTIGLKKAGTVAQERAAEAQAMQERNNTRAMQKAVNQMNQVAKKATSQDTTGLEHAATVIQEIMKHAPEQAQTGLQTALNNINGERQRIGASPMEAPATSQERMNAARQQREQARQQIEQGNADLDAGNYGQAEQHFEQAEQYFQEAAQTVAGLSSTEAQQLRTQLEHSKEGAMDLVNAVQSYRSGDNTTAQQYAQDAQTAFDRAGQGGGPQ